MHQPGKINQENGEGLGRVVSVAAITLPAKARLPVHGLSSKESKFLESFHCRKKTEQTRVTIRLGLEKKSIQVIPVPGAQLYSLFNRICGNKIEEELSKLNYSS